MNSLWSSLAALPVPAEEKYRRALWLLVPLAALAGLLVWALAAVLGLRGWQWPVIFAGYPALVCPVAVFLYGCRHPF